MSSDDLELHPEIRRFTDANTRLRDEVTRLLTEVEDLLRITRPNLLALYQTRIGAWELRALEAQFAVARLRRQVELAQASLNHGQIPDPVAIEGALELEFLAWQTRVREAAERIQAAQGRLEHLLPPAEDRALKELYRALVKRLHPDLNPQVTGDQQRLWLRVQAAYDAGDVQELRALTLLAEGLAAVPPLSKSVDQLRREQAVLKARALALLQRLEQIESEPPFTLRQQLADDVWVAARRQELEAQTALLREQVGRLQTQWRTLMGGTGHGTVSGRN